MADELRDELTNDPLQRGYAQMTDKQAADSLNAADVEQDRTIVPAHEIVDAIVPSEWTVLTDIERGRIGFVVSAGEVNVKAPNVRTAFTTAFAGGTISPIRDLNAIGGVPAPSVARQSRRTAELAASPPATKSTSERTATYKMTEPSPLSTA